MRDRLKGRIAAAAHLANARPKEVRWSLVGAALGVLAGLFVGGVGIVALGDAVGIPAAVILGVIGAIIGNRVGVEFDHRDTGRGKVL